MLAGEPAAQRSARHSAWSDRAGPTVRVVVTWRWDHRAHDRNATSLPRGAFMNQVGPTLQTLRDLADVLSAIPERHDHLRVPPCKALYEVAEGKKYRGTTD